MEGQCTSGMGDVSHSAACGDREFCMIRRCYHITPGPYDMTRNSPDVGFRSGAGVHFTPVLTKYSVDKACARARFDIFLRYRLSPGGRWTGECLVGDLSDFVDLDLCEDASSRWGTDLRARYQGRFVNGSRDIVSLDSEVRIS